MTDDEIRLTYVVKYDKKTKKFIVSITASSFESEEEAFEFVDMMNTEYDTSYGRIH
tara:strand:+ start:1340 stop:1507 length:168 start_codon:yes stop_codon:yes gene_type:complete